MKAIIAVLFLIGCLSSVVHAEQSCNSAIEPSTPSSQFILMGSEVKDVKTNLIWKRCSVGQYWNGSQCTGTTSALSWEQALAQSGSGWRLPNIKELLSIVEVSCGSPAANIKIFPNTPNVFFWTGSPYTNNNQVWSVSFEDGNDEGGNKSTQGAVRLVRNAN